MSAPAGACVICGADATSTMHAADYITGQTFDVRRCLSCGFGSTEPLPASMDVFYPPRYRQYNAATAGVLKALYAWRVRGWARRLRGPGRAFELGCGDGWMLAALRDRGWRVIGSERSLEGARAAATRNHVTTFVGDLDALGTIPRFRAVILFQVLEHLTDPLTVLQRGAAVLEPGGSLLVGVPNYASWQARLFGAAWFHLDVPRHNHHFTPEALTRAMEHAGLRVVSTRFTSFEHDPYGWIQSILNRLGFKQNLLTKWLMGAPDPDATTGRIAVMLALSAVLAIPSVLLAVCSWRAGAGATMEMRAVKV